MRRDPALRRSEGVFLAEGVHLAREALDARAVIEAILVSPRLSSGEDGLALLDTIRSRRLPCHETADETLAAVQDARSAQAVLALVRRPDSPAGNAERQLESSSLVTVLDGIQDPGNLGSVIRSADGAGAGPCFVTGASADPYHPRAVRATMGSIFRVTVVEESLEAVLDRLAARGFELLGTDPREGERYDRVDLSARLALVLGSEAAGLSSRARQRLDRTLRIPMREGVESLSVGAAAAVLLFELARQRLP